MMKPKDVEPGTTGPLKILMTAHARSGLAETVNELVLAQGSRPVELIEFAAPSMPARDDAEIAFVSRDVTGRSTKHELTEQTRACYEHLRGSPKLKWVHVHAAGTDRQIYQDLLRQGVTITTSAGANADVVAQNALAGLLALSRRFPQLARAQRAHRWEPLLGEGSPPELRGQTALVVGWGPIGQTIGRFLNLLGMSLVVVTSQSIDPVLNARRVSFQQIDQAWPEADWVILACPLTEQTRHLIHAGSLSRMRRGAGLINVSRGEVIREQDLIQALREGQIGRAYLDVFEHEPLDPASPLWDMDDLIITPHTAGHFAGHEGRVKEIFLENLGRYCRGEALNNRVAPVSAT